AQRDVDQNSLKEGHWSEDSERGNMPHSEIMQGAANLVPLKLFPAPVRHEVLSCAGELVLLCAVHKHRPDLGSAADGALEDNMPVIGRPRGIVVTAGFVCELDPLERATGDVHHIDILAAGCAGAVFAIPGEGKPLAAWRP